jgi:hypothetical protein
MEVQIMKIKPMGISLFMAAVFLLCIFCKKSITEPNTIELTGAFFNETFPTTTVDRFAPDIFTEELHSPPVFSPDGNEVYWNLMSTDQTHILHMKIENGVWSEPAVASFCIGDYSDSPFITSDEGKLFFLTMDRPAYEERICVAEKQNGKWGNLRILGDEVNGFHPHWQTSAADNQNLYFGGRSAANDLGDIYFSEYVNGNYTTAVKLGSGINTATGHEGSPFIAPDESYLIFDRVIGGTTQSDLFISFKQVDGTWSEAVRMSLLNTGGHEAYAYVSSDGRFIMFLSSRSGWLFPYWVDASIIDHYRD